MNYSCVVAEILSYDWATGRVSSLLSKQWGKAVNRFQISGTLITASLCMNILNLVSGKFTNAIR